MIEHPVVVGVRCNVRPLVGVQPEVEDLRYTERGERLGPDAHGAGGPLFHERQLPVVVAQAGHLLVVVDVNERVPRALRGLPRQVRHEVVAVEVDLVGHVPDLVALE